MPRDLYVIEGNPNLTPQEYEDAPEGEILAQPCVVEALKAARQRGYDEGYDHCVDHARAGAVLKKRDE